MIVQFTVSNYLSFDQQQTLTLTSGKSRKAPDRLAHYKTTKLLKCKSIFGSNASGKTNLIQAIAFMKKTIVSGISANSRHEYFRQSPENIEKPSTFEMEFICDSKRYLYGFSLNLNQVSILKEWLYEIKRPSCRTLIFFRDTQAATFQLGELFRNAELVRRLQLYCEDIQNDDGILLLQSLNTNKNSLYITFSESIVFRNIYEFFANTINIRFPNSSLENYNYFAQTTIYKISNLLHALGTGITSAHLESVSKEQLHNNIEKSLLDEIYEDLEQRNIENKKKEQESLPTPAIMLRGPKQLYIFSIEHDIINAVTLRLNHENPSVSFSLKEESDGTLRLLDLLEILLPIAENKIYIIDELDRCLHPVITKRIIELYLSQAPHRHTQLILTTHEAMLLNRDIFRSDEISFIIKGVNGASQIRSLDSYQFRSDKKLLAALMEDNSGAFPLVTSDVENMLKNT